MTIKALSARGATRSEVARLPGVTEGAVRYHLRRMASATADGRSRQKPAAEAFAEAIGHWLSRQGEEGVNLAALHDWLREDVTYHHCHPTADDLSRRVAAFEARPNQDRCTLATASESRIGSIP